MKQILKDKSGMALPLAIACILVAVILVIGLLTYSSNSVLQYDLVQKNKKAQYLARTGIEAAMRAYTELDEDFKKEKYTQTHPIYQLSDGRFTNDLSAAGAASVMGEVVVKITNQETKEITNNGVKKEFDVVYFDATATMDGQTATAKAYQVKTINGYKNGWYNNNGQIQIPAGMSTNSSGFYVFDFMANLMLPYPPNASGGINTNAKIQLANNQRIAYVGNMVWIEPGITLKMDRTNSGTSKILAAAGKDIVFQGNIDLGIRRTGLAGNNQNLGTLLIAIPENMTYTDPVTNEKVGKVYFRGDVTVSIATGLFPREERAKLFSSGDVYYFKMKPKYEPTNSDINGLYYIDLVRYYLSTRTTSSNNTLYSNLYNPTTQPKNDVKDMRKIDPTKYSQDKYTDLIPPNPDGTAFVVWE